jgi:predicted ATPase
VAADDTLRITYAKLDNWRNFQRAEVELQRRVFLVGPNASGKSNFLDALRFLQDIAAIGGGVQAAIRRRGGVSAIRSLAARKNPDVGLLVRIGTEEEPALWEYSVTFGRDAAKRVIVKKESVRRKGDIILNRPDARDLEDPEVRTQTHLEQVNVNRRFREVAEFLAEIRYLHIVPQLVRDPNRSVGIQNDPFGGDFLEQIANKNVKTRNAWLRRIRQALRVAVPQLRELELSKDEKGTPHLRGKYEHWRAQGAWQTEDRFSDGTLRLIGLLWATLEGIGPLLLEEPELSLHPEVVRYLPAMFARIQRQSGRQFILSTHSPELLQDKGIGLDEVLLLVPQGEGTSVRPASTYSDVRLLLEGGLSMADAVMPLTKPSRADQLSLFSEVAP